MSCRWFTTGLWKFWNTQVYMLALRSPPLLCTSARATPCALPARGSRAVASSPLDVKSVLLSEKSSSPGLRPAATGQARWTVHQGQPLYLMGPFTAMLYLDFSKFCRGQLPPDGWNHGVAPPRPLCCGPAAPPGRGPRGEKPPPWREHGLVRSGRVEPPRPRPPRDRRKHGLFWTSQNWIEV